MLRFSCPGCTLTLQVSPTQAGASVACPKCKRVLRVPAAQPAAAPPPAASADGWYFLRNGQRGGPVGMAQLQQLFAAGQLQATDMIWKQGMPGWVAVDSLPAFRAPSAPSALPPEPPKEGFFCRVFDRALDHFLGDKKRDEDNKADAAPGDPKTTHGNDQRLAAWLFGSVLLVFFLGVFLFAPRELPGFKQRMLGIFAAILAGLFGYFLTGSINVELKGLKSALGELGTRATGGAALFLVVLLWWLSPMAPVGIEKKLDDLQADTSAIKGDTREIKEGVKAIGNLGGLKAKPETAADYWHNFRIHKDNGDVARALEDLEKYFKLEAREYLDPYRAYRDVLEQKYDRAQTAKLLEELAREKPGSLAARLVALEYGGGPDLAERLRQFVDKHPGYLAAYRSLVNALPGDTVFEEYQRSLVRVEYRKHGDVEKEKELYLENPKLDRDFGLSAPLDLAAHFQVLPYRDPDFKGLIFTFDEKKSPGDRDAVPGQELILTFPGGVVAQLPLGPVADGLGGALVELRGSEDGQVHYKKRRANDVRIFKHVGYLEGVTSGSVSYTVEYVDAKGNRVKLPRPLTLAVTRFQAKVLSGAAAVLMAVPRPPQLQVTATDYLRSCEVATKEQGPYLAMPRHPNVPTLFEVELSKVPGFTGKPGVNTFWIKGVDDDRKPLGPEAVSVVCPEGVGDVRGAKNDAESRLVAKLAGHTGIVNAVAFSPDGKLIASGGYDTTLILWDAATNRLLEKLPGHKDRILCLAFAPDSRTVAAGSADGVIVLWDVPTRKPRATIKDRKDADQAAWLAFAPDGKLLASVGYRDGSVRLWDAATGADRGSLTGHRLFARGVGFSSDGKKLATCASDQTVKVWDLEARKVEATFTGHHHQVNRVVFAEKDQVVVSASSDLTVRFWDVALKKSLRTAEEHEAMVFALAVSPDGHVLATGDARGLVKLWDAHDGKVLTTISAHNGSVNCIAFSSDGRTFATASGGADGLKVWSVAER